MKIINKTYWNTRQLKKILAYGLKREGMLGKNLTVEVIHSKRCDNTFVGGYAYFGKGDYSYKTFICLKMPELPMAANILSTFKHELAHTRGIGHKDMFDKHPEISIDEIVKAGIPMSIDKKLIKLKPSAKVLRERRARLNLEKYRKLQKRYANMVKKYQKKVSYYEKRIERKTGVVAD